MDGPEFVSIAGAARVLGVTTERARQLLVGGGLPEPDGWFLRADGRRPLWELEEFRRFADGRDTRPGRRPA